MTKYAEVKKTFDEWLLNPFTEVPLVAWGDEHTEIAVLFAQKYAQIEVRRALDQALNEGDGTYKP